jgi:hypothetical protein
MASLPSTLPPPFRIENDPSGLPEFWTFDAVEDRFIEAMRFAWRDEPGSWPFAGDGPWDLIVKETREGDYDKRGGDLDAPPPPRVPLSRAERARMDEAVGWLALVPEAKRARAGGAGGARGTGASDARLIVLVARKLGAVRGEARGQVRWSLLLRHMGLKKGAGALAKRYVRAISALAMELERRGVPVELARDCPSRG